MKVVCEGLARAPNRWRLNCDRSSTPARGSRPYPVQRPPRGSKFLAYLRTTDPKVLGVMYITTSFSCFMVGGLMALLMRAELARPGLQFLAPEQYNQLFTMHGTIMLLFYATPVVFGFANLVLPLQIGAPDVAFPRLNALSYWLYLFGALIAISGFFTPGGAAAFGWTAYAPLSGRRTPRGSAATCGSWAWRCPGWAPSWVGST